MQQRIVEDLEQEQNTRTLYQLQYRYQVIPAAIN